LAKKTKKAKCEHHNILVEGNKARCKDCGKNVSRLFPALKRDYDYKEDYFEPE